MATDRILFTLLHVPKNGVWVLPLEIVPVPGHSDQLFAHARKKTMFRLVPMPEHREWASSLNRTKVFQADLIVKCSLH